MREIKQWICLCFMTIAFWGVMYPQFSLVEESYECKTKEKNPREDFFAILDADKGEIVIKSKFLELLMEKRK
ncbi:MAG: hypothetical protein IKW30_11495 [Lachnospiraceae bacterium]|nr:hypothetical protein [Lachnospiraceae bacterium]